MPPFTVLFCPLQNPTSLPSQPPLSLLTLFALLSLTSSFVPLTPSLTLTSSQTRSLSPLTAAFDDEEEELRRAVKGNRFAAAGDRVIELKKPLGVVLDQDDRGNVYVSQLAPMGNAARTGAVSEGDIVVMCSATFGDQLWSTRGCGLPRVLKAIKVRAGPTVTLVLESPADAKKKTNSGVKALKAREEARAKAQKKKDELLAELQDDENDLKKSKKFFGLF